MIAAFLWAQMEEADEITRRRLAIWSTYHSALAPLAAAKKLRCPAVPNECTQNGHMYYIVLPSLDVRTNVIAQLKARGINAVFHYVSLHDSPMGKRMARPHGDLAVTRRVSDTLLRLPFWLGIEVYQQKIVQELSNCLAR